MRLTFPHFLDCWNIGSHLTVLIGEKKPDANHQQKQAPFDDPFTKGITSRIIMEPISQVMAECEKKTWTASLLSPKNWRTPSGV